MKKIVKATSVNCDVCSREILSYQIRTAKIGSVLREVCPICHEHSNAYNEFKASLSILAEMQKAGQLNTQVDPMVSSPNISIEPIDSNIQAACELLKRMDGNFFKGVSKIVAGTEANYGHTDSKDPTILYINLNRIVSESGKDSKRNIIIQLSLTVAHEAAHSKSFDGQKFVGGESVAEAEEQKVSNWIKANESKLQDLFK